MKEKDKYQSNVKDASVQMNLQTGAIKLKGQPTPTKQNTPKLKKLLKALIVKELKEMASKDDGPSFDQMTRQELINFLGTTEEFVASLSDEELLNAAMEKNSDLGGLEEMSTSGDAGAYSSKFFVNKSGKENKATKSMKWKPVKGMPKNSKMLDYKEMWPGKKSAMNENMSTAERLIKQAEKEGRIKGDYSQRVLDAAKKVAKDYDGLKNDEERKVLRDQYYNEFLKTSGLKESLLEIIEQELINESNYHKFKSEVKYRTKNEALHKAIREVKRKLNEVDRLIDYTTRMKQELSENENGISYWKRSLKAVDEINETSNRISNKIKSIYQ
jgi:tellurite resistance protein